MCLVYPTFLIIITVMIRLYNSSMIRYSSRLNYDVACTMDFRRFPFDSQVQSSLTVYQINPCLQCCTWLILVSSCARWSLSRFPTQRHRCNFSGDRGVIHRLPLLLATTQVFFFQLWMFQVNPGITLDQFALDVELVDNYKTDSYDLEYPGLIMTIRLVTITTVTMAIKTPRYTSTLNILSNGLAWLWLPAWPEMLVSTSYKPTCNSLEMVFERFCKPI